MIGKIKRGGSYLVSLPEPPKKYDPEEQGEKMTKWFDETFGVKATIIWIPGSTSMRIWQVPTNDYDGKTKEAGKNESKKAPEKPAKKKKAGKGSA